jgi:hypothetical protein
MTATRKVSRSRKRPARTPPSTFLFLPIHLSNNPGREPRLRLAPEPLKPRASDMAIRSWPDARSPQNSEGLVDAPSRQAAARQEEVYSLRPPVLSTVQVRKYGLWTSRRTRVKTPPALRLRHTTDQGQDFSALPRRPVLACAALEPHSSAVLAHSCRGMPQSGGTPALDLLKLRANRSGDAPALIFRLLPGHNSRPDF